MRWTALFIVLITTATSHAQTTRPATTAPSAGVTPPTADQLLNQMLQPADNDRSAALLPQAVSTATASNGATGILREGTDIVDRVGRLQKNADGQQDEFVFESDGKTLHDPPVLILPNLKLMQMETALTTSSHDLRFRITGTVTEYRGRNYILLEKVVVVQDKNQDF